MDETKNIKIIKREARYLSELVCRILGVKKCKVVLYVHRERDVSARLAENGGTIYASPQNTTWVEFEDEDYFCLSVFA